MKYGKRVCFSLKQVRKQIADANEISFEVTECKHQGDCHGTCPKCEAELRYIENQLSLRRAAGMAVTVVGLSLGVATTFSSCAAPQSPKETDEPTIKDLELEKNEEYILDGDIIEQLPESEQTEASSNIQNSLKDIDIPFCGEEEILPPYREEIKPSKIDDDGDDTVFMVVDEYPEFPGGDSALMLYISKYLIIPSEIEVTGSLAVSFIIEKDGSISDIKELRSPSEELSQVAIRLVESMPKWKPGKINGKVVRTKYQIPINIRPQ